VSALVPYPYAILPPNRRLGRPLAVLDGQIASIARANGCAVATRNVRDFVECGVEVVNPFEAPIPGAKRGGRQNPNHGLPALQREDRRTGRNRLISGGIGATLVFGRHVERPISGQLLAVPDLTAAAAAPRGR
jgi:hypothetical protein